MATMDLVGRENRSLIFAAELLLVSVRASRLFTAAAFASIAAAADESAALPAAPAELTRMTEMAQVGHVTPLLSVQDGWQGVCHCACVCAGG